MSGNNDDDDEMCCVPCKKEKKIEYIKAVGEDPRFQQQNQTMRCFVSYRDYYRCENILGKDQEACAWFKDVFTEFCPISWIEKWDDQRKKNIFVGDVKDRSFVKK